MSYHIITTKRDFVELIAEVMEVKTKKPFSLIKAFDRFLIACEARQLSLHTIEDYTRTIKRFLDHVGDMPMNDVTPSLVADFLASQSGVSAKTVLNRHIGLSAFWTWAMKQEIVDRNIVRMVEKPKPQQVVIEPFTEVEIRALLTEMRHHPERDRSIIYLLLDCGIRASELVGLRREDIDLDQYRIKVKGGKGNKDRNLPFSRQTASILLRYLSKCEGKPYPIKRRSLTSLMVRLGQRTGVKDCHPHRFRHTFAITYLRNGGDSFTLQILLGHSTMEMVKRYLAIAQVDLDRAHRRASPVENWNL